MSWSGSTSVPCHVHLIGCLEFSSIAVHCRESGPTYLIDHRRLIDSSGFQREPEEISLGCSLDEALTMS